MKIPTHDKSIGLTPGNPEIDGIQKLGLAIMGLGFVGFVTAAFGVGTGTWPMFLAVFGLIAVGALIHSVRTYKKELPGIRNNRAVTASLTGRGALGWMIGIFLTGFYIVHYWWDHLFANLHDLVDPISQFMRGSPADKYFFYAFLYSVAIAVMGTRALYRYRHSRYQLIRTSVVIFSQLVFAFSIPYIMARLAGKEFWPSYFWPLGYSSLFPDNVNDLIFNRGGLGAFILGWGLIMILIATPVLTFFFGKRWYCSWICGCGGLANTFGDSWRHLSNKSLRAWKIERWLIYPGLVFITLTTIALWPLNSQVKQSAIPLIEAGIEQITSWDGVQAVKKLALEQPATYGAAADTFLGWYTLKTRVSKTYSFFIGMIFAGVIGTGFYPILGTRVWCRFGCPMAAILGLLQKFFSRFRITTNGGQCISCGNCSKYCEMGIDVRAYAQRGENIVRASCVGCGMCAAVCPRGVLSLENGPRKQRTPGDLSLTRPSKSGIEFTEEMLPKMLRK